MRVRHGLISSDSHANVHRDAFVERMSAATWGDRIPHVREVELDGRTVERWVVDGRVASPRGVVNCAAVMDDPLRRTFPQRWEDVPAKVYDPAARLRALDEDGVDGEVLFFNDPVDSAKLPFGGEPAYELACVRAYNEALAEWAAVSDRYLPLALLPWRSDVPTIVDEVRRAVELGHRGVIMVAEPSAAGDWLPHFNDAAWHPLWATCEELAVPVHWHAHAGIRLLPSGWESNQALRRTAAFSVQPQYVANFVLSGVADRFPGLRLVCAETGIGWLGYVMQATDHVWERGRLWRHGVPTRPSEVVRRQVAANFWYERWGVELRHAIGVDNLMWASDYPHGTSTYPDSWRLVEHVMEGVGDEDRAKLLYRNALAMYGASAEPAGDLAATARA